MGFQQHFVTVNCAPIIPSNQIFVQTRYGRCWEGTVGGGGGDSWVDSSTIGN
jgi:hypothetical protein